MIKDVLKEELVEVDVVAETWQEVIQKAGNLLVNDKKIDAVFIEFMIDTVKELGPYMILLPDVAFFHGKPSSAVKQPCLSFVTLQDDVYFDEFEHQRIKCAFAFGAVDSDSHMAMLASVANLLQDEEFIRLATQHGHKEDIMNRIRRF